MGEERFDRLEGPDALPGDVRQALSSLSRFEHLEIGAFQAPPREAPKGQDKLLCPHCGQANERERQTCWACFKAFSAKAKAPTPAATLDVTVVLDGTTYRSTDQDLPDDIKVLMERIRKDGYSEKLLTDWRSWRATRRSPPPPARPFEPSSENAAEDPQRDIKVFKGQRVSVIRLDGQVYTSDDPKLSPEMRQLFQYVETHGVTPALMEYLRQFGSRVKFRPADTLMPTDGDVTFWNHVKSTEAAPSPARELARWEAETDLALARQRVSLARGRMLGAALGVVFFLLYVFLVLR